MSVLAIEKSLSTSDFKTANTQTGLLPHDKIVVKWDDSIVAAKDKSAFALQRDNVFRQWKSAANIDARLAESKPDILFVFAPLLPNSPVMDLPPGIAYTWSDDPGKPRLTATLALTKGNPAAPVPPSDIHNAVCQAMGVYLGLGFSPIPGTLMGGTELSFSEAFEISDSDASNVSEALRISTELRADVLNRKPVSVAMPKASLDTDALDMGEHLQGEPAPFKLKISNQGNSTLTLRFMPDCGCVVTQRNATVDAGKDYVLEGSFDTTLRFGDIRHVLQVSTNDPDTPSVSVPIHIVVRPKYRLLIENADSIQLTDDGPSVTAYLLTAPDSSVTISQAVVGNASSSTSTIEKWSGTIADPEMGEPPKPRTGFKIVLHLKGPYPTVGRIPMTLAVSTSDPQFRTLVATFFGQKGIAATPSQMYMGQLGRERRNYSLFVSGPGGNFHVKNVKCEWPYVTFQVFTSKDGAEYRIQAAYDGKAPKGDVHTKLIIETSDLKQPVIEVPITGIVN